MDFLLTYLADGLVKLNGPEGCRTGIATNLSSRVFRSVDIGKLQSGNGWILDSRGGMTPWKIEGMLEDQGKIIFYGPRVKGKTAAPENLDQEDLILLGRTVILAGEKNLPVEGFFTRGWYIMEDSRVLLFPPELMDFIRKNQAEAVKQSCWYPYNHPEKHGTEGLCFSLAALTYRVLTKESPYRSSGEEIAQEIRTQPVIPPRYKAPGLKKEFSDFLEKILDPREEPPKLNAWSSYLNNWEKEGLFLPLKEDEKAAIEKELEELQAIREAKIRIKGFWHRKNTVILTAVLAASVIAGFLIGPVKAALAPPETMGMSPREVVETYYDCFSTLDQDLMEDCIDKRTGAEDLKEITNFFVTSRVRQGYEGSTGLVSAEQWEQQGRPLPEPGVTVYGVTNRRISLLDENRYQICYEKWYPGVPDENKEDLHSSYPRGYRIRDIAVLEKQKKGNWMITGLNRSVDDL